MLSLYIYNPVFVFVVFVFHIALPGIAARACRRDAYSLTHHGRTRSAHAPTLSLQHDDDEEEEEEDVDDDDDDDDDVGCSGFETNPH